MARPPIQCASAFVSAKRSRRFRYSAKFNIGFTSAIDDVNTKRVPSHIICCLLSNDLQWLRVLVAEVGGQPILFGINLHSHRGFEPVSVYFQVMIKH